MNEETAGTSQPPEAPAIVGPPPQAGTVDPVDEFRARVAAEMQPKMVQREETASERWTRVQPIMKAEEDYLLSLRKKEK